MEDAVSYLRWTEAERAITKPRGDGPTEGRASAEAGEMAAGERKVQTTDRNGNSFFRGLSEETICPLKLGYTLVLSWNDL